MYSSFQGQPEAKPDIGPLCGQMFVASATEERGGKEGKRNKEITHWKWLDFLKTYLCLQGFLGYYHPGFLKCDSLPPPI